MDRADTASVAWLVESGDGSAASDRGQAAALGLTCVSQPPEHGFYLARNDIGLALHHSEDSGGSGLRCALSDPTERATRQAGGRRSPLARALGLHRHPPMRVLDATAGLARDAATLASLGCDVTAVERHPALYALLEDASHQLAAASDPPFWWRHWQPPIHADAAVWLAGQSGQPSHDVIYIDPMFVSPRRKSAPQKALQWLAELAGRDHDAAALLEAARTRAARRVVVKQHARAEPMAPADLQIRGRAIRFDIYLIPNR